MIGPLSTRQIIILTILSLAGLAAIGAMVTSWLGLAQAYEKQAEARHNLDQLSGAYSRLETLAQQAETGLPIVAPSSELAIARFQQSVVALRPPVTLIAFDGRFFSDQTLLVDMTWQTSEEDFLEQLRGLYGIQSGIQIESLDVRALALEQPAERSLIEVQARFMVYWEDEE